MSNQATKSDEKPATPAAKKLTFYLPDYGVNVEAATLDEAIELAKKANKAKGVK